MAWIDSILGFLTRTVRDNLGIGQRAADNVWG
jgi:hypothetical protein